MKNMKKIASMIMTVIMVFAMMTTAFADTTKGSITINGVSDENVYEIYKLLNLESYDLESKAYSYKVNEAWAGFFSSTEAKLYITVDETGYVTWIKLNESGNVNPEDTETFAKLALKHAKENDIAPIKSTSNEGDYKTGTKTVNNEVIDTITFESLELGYYLIDSTMGALCGLTTTNPEAYINAKNKAPTIDKQVLEDSTNQWGDTNSADIGQTVEFRVTINVHDGAENYVLHDIMSDGLTFDKVTKIEHVETSVNKTEVVPTTAYEVKTSDEVTELTNDDTDDNSKPCTFEVVFTQGFCDYLKTNDKVVVHYQAVLNKDAVVAGAGNPNETWLDYGEDHHTTHDTTTTYTFAFDLVKTDSQNKLIDGAAFKIYDKLTDGNEVPVVLSEDGVTYRRAKAGETGVAINVTNGKVRVIGFDNGTYYLEETVTPSGYNQLAARQEFIISDANRDAIVSTDNIVSTGSGVHVVNKSGTMLPETGGMGTTLLYIAGGALVLLAVVLLITKKRMGNAE